MYGVVEVSGHQYKVQVGDIIDVEKLSVEKGADLDLDQVLFVGGKKPLVGAPIVSGALVKAKVIRQGRSKKVVVFKRKPGMYQKKNGHRQYYTALLITEVNDGQGNSHKIDATSQKAEKYLKEK